MTKEEAQNILKKYSQSILFLKETLKEASGHITFPYNFSYIICGDKEKELEEFLSDSNSEVILLPEHTVKTLRSYSIRQYYNILWEALLLYTDGIYFRAFSFHSYNYIDSENLLSEIKKIAEIIT